MELLKSAEKKKTISDILERGMLSKVENGKTTKVEYEMKFLGEEFLDEVIELERLVVSLLEREDLFVKDTRDFFTEKILDDKGLLIGVLCDKQLVAYRSVSFPKDSERNFGKHHTDIPADELPRVMHFEATVVHPHYRGNSLQEKMSRYALDFARARGIIHVCTTISPFNYPSLKNIMGIGLTAKGIRRIENEEYAGKLRLLLSMDMRKEPLNLYSDSIDVDHRDYERQKELMDMGYVGYGVKKTSQGFDILYGRP